MRTTKEDVLKAVKHNSMHINAMNSINAPKEVCEMIGRRILQMLDDDKNLLPVYLDGELNESTKDTMLRLAELTKCLYICINKS